MRASVIIAGMLVALPIAAHAQAPAAPPDTLLHRLLLANRHEVTLTGGQLDGPGGRLLVDEGKASQFFLVGEEHGVAEIPQVIAALLRELRPAGYSHFAIEVSPLQAGRFNALRGRPDPRADLEAMFDTWVNAAPFYTMRTEADLLAEALGRQAGVSPMTIMGLDYDVMGDRYWLRRLETLTPAARRGPVTRARELADSGFARLAGRGDPSGLFAWSASDSVFRALREAVRPPAGSEAERIIGTFERTARINRAFIGGKNFLSNQDRSAWLRENFARELAAARRGGAPLPRTLLKFGAYHMMRGYTNTRVLDLGSAAEVIATGEGKKAFNVLMVGGADSKHAQMNIVKLRYDPADGAFVRGPDAAWVLSALPPTGWTLFDLRPVRAEYFDKRGRSITAGQERLLLAFDAILVLTGSIPNEGISMAPR